MKKWWRHTETFPKQKINNISDILLLPDQKIIGTNYRIKL